MEQCALYLKKRHRKWWAIHDVPPSLRSTLGVSRFATSLDTDDERTARRRADTLWLHDWSKTIERAKGLAPEALEKSTGFYRRLLQQNEGEGSRITISAEAAREAKARRLAIAAARSEKERGDELYGVEAEADKRHREALRRAGYEHEHEVPLGEDVPGVAEADRFYKLATGKMVPTMEHMGEWLSTLSNEAKTKDMKRSTVVKFSETFPYLQDVNRKDVQRWLNTRAAEEGLTGKTLKRVLSELRSYWGYLQSLELVEEEASPFEKLTITGKRSEDRKPFEPAEVVSLLNAAKNKGDKTLADVITLGMWTGARIESLCKLRVENVRDGFIRIEDDKTEAGTRDVPIHSKLKSHLKRLVKESTDGYVLSGLSANKYGDRSDAVGKRFGRLKADLGFGEAHVFHSIRKTVTTILENAGVSENTAADIVGHDKPRITYGLYSGGANLETKRKALEKLAYPGL
jgi:integrase